MDGSIAAEDESSFVILGRLNSDRQLNSFAEAKHFNCLLLG